METSLDDDEELVRRSVGGDRLAFAVLCRRHGQAIMRNAARHVTDLFLVEDAMQNALLRFWNNLHAFDAAKGDFRAFLSTLFRRELVNEMRRMTHRGREILDDEAAHSSSPPWLPEDATPRDALAQIEAMQTAMSLRSAVDRLPPKQRQAVEHYLGDHDSLKNPAIRKAYRHATDALRRDLRMSAGDDSEPCATPAPERRATPKDKPKRAGRGKPTWKKNSSTEGGA